MSQPRPKVNLASEVHQTNQRNKQRKKLASTIATGIGITCGIIIGVLVLLVGAQKVTIAAQNNEIKKRQNEIAQIQDLKRAVTLQEHLKSWKEINDEKVYLSRFFEVLQEFAPQGVSISNLQLSEDNILTVTATAKGYPLATKFAKALEAANVEVGKNASDASKPYFTNVELKAVSDNGDGLVSFKLSTEVSGEVVQDGN